MLRPRPARWFEVLVAREDVTLALEALARTGAVELEAPGGVDLPVSLREVLPLLAQYFELSARYHAYWPAPAACRPAALPRAPLPTLQRSLEVIRAWALQAEPLVQALQRGERAREELQLWQRVLTAMQARALDPRELVETGPWLQLRLLVLPPGCAPERVLTPGLQDIVATTLDLGEQQAVLVVGTPAAVQALALQADSLKARVREAPEWLQADAAWNRAWVAMRLAAIARDAEECGLALAALHRRHELPRALGDANRLQWLMQNVHALESGELLCWITGWSSDAQGGMLTRALQDSGARALWRFATPPEGLSAPLLLRNPGWARPFEIFARALGTPASSEVDPSGLLAIAMPLMFGYMFGDVGQGVVLALAAWWLRERYAVARLLMVGGVAAALFGLVFGSVFSIHGLLPALWLQPLEAPLPVLLVPLVGGAVLLGGGLGLNALEAHWRGELRRWLVQDAALALVYLGLLGAVFTPTGLAVAAAAALYCCIAQVIDARRLTAGFAALGRLLEQTVQLLINTLSFARVGAFALAHAGLSSAIVALMDAANGVVAKALVLVFGNVVVLVLEVLVVSIQTTRLVLFEFFTRFMQGQGRAFRPLPAPPFS